MKIEKLRNKVKIQFEYSTKSEIEFEQITPEDMKKLVISIFLKDGSRIDTDLIDYVTLKARDD